MLPHFNFNCKVFMCCFKSQFKAAIADLKTPFKTDHYLLTWLRGMYVCTYLCELVCAKPLLLKYV